MAATFGVILSAAYMLWLVQRLFYGQPSALAAKTPSRDLRFHELAAVTPLAVLMLVMGVAPMLWMRAITATHPPPQNPPVAASAPDASLHPSFVAVTSPTEGKR